VERLLWPLVSANRCSSEATLLQERWELPTEFGILTQTFNTASI
jgi:hypothetical protein